MTLHFGFILTNYILYGLGVYALLVSEALSLPVVIFSLLLLLVLFFAELKGNIPVIKNKHFIGFYIGPLTLIGGYFIFNLQLLDFFCYFLLILLFTRIVYKKEMNDYIFCYIISLACLLISAMGTAEFAFAIIFVLFFIVISWSMILYHLRVEKETTLQLNNSALNITENERDPRLKERIGKSFFGLTSFLVLSSLIVTLIIFFLMPRLGKGYLSLYGKTRLPVSGFSTEVELGDIGRIKLDNSVVMRIETFQNGEKIVPGDDIYWRGIALDHYDGRRWSNTFSNKKNLKKIARTTYKIDDRKSSSKIMESVIYLDPIGSDLLFTAGRPLSLNGSFRWLKIDQNHNLYRSSYPFGRVRLVVTSDVSKKDKFMLSPNKDNIVSSDKEKYLQLPPLSDHFIEFTNNIVKDTEKKYNKAVAIESYLKINLGYTLDQSMSENISPIDHFLFEKKQGHCEYFASAMVLMLRTLDIPARLVNGFMRGEWNQFGEYLLVRQSHAHSWVEAMPDNRGWVIFDPTPAAATPYVSSSFPATVERYMDAIKMKWFRYIINFSWRDQEAIAITARNKTITVKEKFNANFTELLHNLKTKIKNSRPDKIVLYLLLFIFLFIAARKFISEIRFKLGNNAYHYKKSSEIYFKMVKLLARKGFDKNRNITPRKFAFQIKNDIGPTWGKINFITDLYYKTRFGDYRLDKKKEKELEQSLKDLARQI